MKIEITELHFVHAGGADDQAECSLRELAVAAQLSEAEIRELVEVGALQPLVGTGAAEAAFTLACLPRLRALRRLRQDLELDAQGASVALALLERIDELERQLRRMRAQLPQSLP